MWLVAYALLVWWAVGVLCVCVVCVCVCVCDGSVVGVALCVVMRVVACVVRVCVWVCVCAYVCISFVCMIVYNWCLF